MQSLLKLNTLSLAMVHSKLSTNDCCWQVGLKYGLPLLSPVDDAGVFTDEAGRFEGLQVWDVPLILGFHYFF